MTETIYAGDDDRLEFTATKSDGTALDLTNMGIVWALAEGPKSAAIVTKDVANTGEIDVVDAANGRFDVILVPADTDDLGGRAYYHEVELTDADDNEFTVFDGDLFVQQTLV